MLLGGTLWLRRLVVSKSELVNCVREMSILLWADVRFGAHRPATQWAERAPCRHDRRGLGTEVACLTAGDANG
jgi:hypothetical protein